MALPPASASQTRLALIEASRGEYRGQLVQRFWLRFHMSLMLAATVGTGILANRLLLGIPVHAMTLRWLLALAISYGAFFVFIRVWLAYVGARPLPLDLGNDVPLNVDVFPRSGGSIFQGGGGAAGGGGASGSWGDAIEAPVKGAFDGAGSVDVGDAGCLVVILGVVLLALLAAIGGGVAFLIVAAPHMLADAAFSALLAGGLVKSVRRMDEPDWEGSVLQATWKPLAIVAVLVVIAGFTAQFFAPGARTLGEVLMLLR